MKLISLQELAKTTTWNKIQTRHKHGKNTNIITVSLTASKPCSSIINRVCIMIGKDITNELGWHLKDKIHVLTNPDDALAMMLVKSDSNNGATLGYSNKTCRNLRIQFTFNAPFLLQKTKACRVDHLHIKKMKQILLRLPQ